MAAPEFDLANFVPVPSILAAEIVAEMAGVTGLRTLTAKVFILSKVCRKAGWQGLALDEFKLSPKELGVVLRCTPQKATRVLQALKQQGWIRSTGVPGVNQLVHDNVYASVADVVRSMKRQVAETNNDGTTHSTGDVIPDGLGDVHTGVMGGVYGGAQPTCIKPNDSAVSQHCQESIFPKDKITSLLSSSSESEDEVQEQELTCPVGQIDGDLLEDKINEFLCLWNEIAPAIGLKVTSLVTPAIREEATLRFNRGVTRDVCKDGLAWMSGFKPGWWSIKQPDYSPLDFLRKVDVYAAKQREKLIKALSEEPSSSSPSRRNSKKKPGVSAVDLKESLGIHWPVIQDVFSQFAGKVNPIEDGPALKAILDQGQQTPDRLLLAARAKAQTVTNGRQYVTSLSEWIASLGWLVVPENSALSNIEAGDHPRAGTDAAYVKGEQASNVCNPTENNPGPSPLVARLAPLPIH